MVEITTRSVTFRVNGEQASGHEARPVGTGPFPGVVVIQEWWGLEPHIKDVAERFAREGYYALAPDLYHGQVTEEPDEAMKLTRALDRDLAVKEIEAAIRHIKSQPSSNKKVGVIGYCMGGGLAFAAAINSRNVDAANPYYGGVPNPVEQVERIQCPLMAFFSATDRGVPENVPVLEQTLKRFGKRAECRIYDAPHAFFNDRRPSYREEAAKDAWQRTLAFFQQHLS